MVELLALGPVELWHHEQQCALGSPRARCVLAVLIHARCEPVTVEALIHRVWDDEPPPTAVDTLHTYLSRIRRRLRESVGDLAEVRRPSRRQYQLRVDPEDVDLLRFQRLRNDAGAEADQGRTESAVGLLRAAEALWRSEPLTEFTSTWASSARARLIEDLRRVREERIRLELELGRHADLIGELRELASQNPLAQNVIASLMLALYRSGRHDEALDHYRITHRRLDVEQGIGPGAELRELHLRILEQDRTLRESVPRNTPAPAGAPASAPASAPAAVPGPGAAPAGPRNTLPRNNLPRDTRDFTGRKNELRVLLAAPESDDSGATALPLTVIHGMPGIGKTALAIHAAHRMRASYPDGLFYVDLHAYSDRPPRDPAEALAALLHACGTPHTLPDSLDERAADWREWTARHRALVILDNARDAAQVRPLLPGAPTCRAIVTSRNRLATLDGATPLPVSELSGPEAERLFTRIAGAARVAADPAALRQVVDACGCHPLTIQLLASNFRHRDSWDLRHLLDRLDRTAGPLDEFSDSITSAFRFSYAELSAHARLLLRRLALHTGPDITLGAATALAAPDGGPTAADHEGDPVPIHRSVEELLDGHLLEEAIHERYRLHDLTRAFGVRVCAEADPEPVRRAAVERLLAYYLTAAHRAGHLSHPHHRTLSLGPERESPYAPEFTDPDEASAWLSVERANLLAVARTAAAEAPSYAAYFPCVLATSLNLWGTWDIAADLYSAAVPALRALGDRAVLARTLVERAAILAQKGHGEALSCAAEALAVFQDLDEPHGCADALLQSGRAELGAGHNDTALVLLDRALVLYQEVGDRSGEAQCLNVKGAAVAHAGRHNEAFVLFRAGLRSYEELGDVHGLIKVLNNVGQLHYRLGQLENARGYYERSLALVQRRGGRRELAILHTNLGAIHQANGQTDPALDYFRRALASHRSGGDALGEVNVLISLGKTYADTGRREEALRYFDKAEEIARAIDNGYELHRTLLGAADVQRASGRLDTALKVYHQALRVARDIGFPLGMAQALAGLTRTALLARSIGVAYGYGERAVTIYQSLEAETEAESLRSLLLDHGVTGS
jgi:DNA-binding SARP family transcriptional activator/Tfp pilus assembly protein PilF